MLLSFVFLVYVVLDKGRDHVLPNDDTGQQSSEITNHNTTAAGAASQRVTVSADGVWFAEELLGGDAE